MRSNAGDVKIVAKFRKDESLPFGVMQVCAKCVGLLYDDVNCGSETQKTGNLRNVHLQMIAFCSKSFDAPTS